MKNTATFTLIALTALLTLGAPPARADDARYFELSMEIGFLKAQIDDLETELAKVDSAIAYCRSQIAYYEYRIATCAWWLPGTASLIYSWRYEINRNKSIIAALEAKRSDLVSELDHKTQLLKHKEYELSRLPRPTANFDSGLGSTSDFGSTSDTGSGGTSGDFDSTQVKN